MPSFQMFNELHSVKGRTRFSIKISDSCEKCFNVRLLKVTSFFFTIVYFKYVVAAL